MIDQILKFANRLRTFAVASEIKTLSKRTLALVLTTIVGSASFSGAAFGAESLANLDELLKSVQQDQIQARPELKKREQEFIQKRAEQKRLLEQAKKELSQEEAVTVRLTKDFEANEKELTELETKLAVVMGTLGELFGVVKQVAGDTKGQLESSIISAEIPGRVEFAADLAQRKALPSIAELEKLWFLLQQEMTESGKVSRFDAEVVKPNGERRSTKVTRVGSFNLVADDKYYIFQPETQQIVELPRQPAGRYLSLIEDIEEGKESRAAFGLDPSRGALLSMLVQAPSFMERIHQGGLVGYIILALLAVGLALVAERFVTLSKQKKLIEDQLKADRPLPGNPLGEIFKAFQDNKNRDLETLEIKMDEALMKVVPTIERGIPTLKVLFAVGPLLGLLGTVTGMIATFQSITLFGTGDPKLMAGGISQALVTTVQGLTCAIPLLLLHNLISSRAKGLIQILEEQMAGLLGQKVETAKVVVQKPSN